jgi:hypothetical protein
MPFDKLPGRVTHIPELYPRLILPPRPVTPWASMIVPAVDELAKSAAWAMSPYEQQKRGLEMAQLGLAPQQLALQQKQTAAQTALLPAQTALNARELAYKQNLLGYNEKILAGGTLQPGMVMGKNGPEWNWPAWNAQEKARRSLYNNHYLNGIHDLVTAAPTSPSEPPVAAASLDQAQVGDGSSDQPDYSTYNALP